MSIESPEECQREAEECERLAGLARSIASRQMMMVIAYKWRRLAERAVARRNAGGAPALPRAGDAEKPN